jgi:hypothetical protein
MKNILRLYEEASGQAISLPKFEIFYSRNVSNALKQSITDIMGVQAVLGTDKYLGLPLMIGRNRMAVFAYVKDHVWQKINSWSCKCLSKAGWEVMIKSVLQAIPSYIMSIFLLPDTIISTIENMMNSFWWGCGGSRSRGIHWMSWEKLSVHKSHGGMGFKDLRRDGFWQGIWRLKVPPKIKNLMWRMCRNVIPTRRRLQDKGVQCPLTCVVCNGPEEDLDHICFTCPFSVQV